MGCAVLLVYGICSYVYRARCLRKYSCNGSRAYRMVTSKRMRCLRCRNLCTCIDNSTWIQRIKFQPFAEGTAWLDLWDFIVSNNILPLGSLVLALFCCNKFGWGWDKFMEEANTGKGLKIKSWMKPIFKYFVPAAILFIYIYGMINFKWK